jgi:hypothetical protein
MKHIFLCSIALMLVSGIYAINIESKGIMAGVNISTFYEDDQDSYDRKIGLDFGCFVNWETNFDITLQTELHYSDKGTLNNFKDTTHKYHEKIILKYLEMPFLFKYSPEFEILPNVSLGKYYPSIYIGPAVSYIVESKYSSTISTANRHSDSFPDVSKVICYLVMGGCINMDKFTLEGRVNVSSVPVQKHGKAYNGSTQVFVGYKF